MLNTQEILHVADALAREKGIEREEVIEAMEYAIQKVARTKYGQENDIRASMDRKTGEIQLTCCQEIVEEIENESTQITLDAAHEIKSDYKVGDIITEDLPPIEFGRVATQTAKQVIVQRIRDAERQRQFNEYKDRAGDVVSGLVKRVEFGNVMVDLGRAEALLRRDETIPRESLRVGDRVRAYIAEVIKETRGAQIFLSRTHPQFMAELFKQEVPEIYDEVIKIKSVARDPGSRAKISVVTTDPSIDPVGACVGMRGSRVQAVVNELQGEKIDIIPWSDNPAEFIVNALIPAEVTKVVLDEENNQVEVVVPDDQLSLTIGRRGQNVRLASRLTGWEIDITTESDESARRNLELKARTQLFMSVLDVDDVIAHLLASEGFTSIEDIVYVPVEDLITIEGFDEEIAGELQERAKNYLKEQHQSFLKQVKELGLDKKLADVKGLTPQMILILSKKGIKTIDNLADLARDELIELMEKTELEENVANEIIMSARSHWFKNEDDKKKPKE